MSGPKMSRAEIERQKRQARRIVEDVRRKAQVWTERSEVTVTPDPHVWIGGGQSEKADDAGRSILYYSLVSLMLQNVVLRREKLTPRMLIAVNGLQRAGGQLTEDMDHALQKLQLQNVANLNRLCLEMGDYSKFIGKNANEAQITGMRALWVRENRLMRIYNLPNSGEWKQRIIRRFRQ